MGAFVFKQQKTVQESSSQAQPIKNEFINELISSNEIVIFSKSNCSYCHKAKTSLDKHEKKFLSIEIDNNKNCPNEDCARVIQDLILHTQMKTVPQIFYKGKLIGGYTELEKEISNGLFKKS